jgi:predicted nucleic acid-binding Zn ribbon protein
MSEHGWAVSPISAAVPGTYCLSCASALQMLEWFVRCVECGAIVEDERVAERHGWRFYAHKLGHLEPHCGLCAAERRLSETG